MTVNQAISCVRSYWNVTCPVGQKQAADALMNEVVWLRLQFQAIQKIVLDGVDGVEATRKTRIVPMGGEMYREVLEE